MRLPGSEGQGGTLRRDPLSKPVYRIEKYCGRVPRRLEELTDLPYVGRYAANAVMCFAYGNRRPVIDANVSRVYQRILG
jgi:adenine-specific DNA glycosylase